MRIVHVIDYFQPKLGYQEYFLAKEHQRLGHDVYVVTSDRYSPFVYKSNKKILRKRIKGVGFFVEEGIKVWRLKTAFEKFPILWMNGLEKKMKELDPNVVISHGIAKLYSIRLARLKEKLNFKLIFDDHMLFQSSKSKSYYLYKCFSVLFSNLIKNRADALVAIHPETVTFMNKFYNFPKDIIKIIPLGVDISVFKFSSKYRKKIRSELKIKENEIVFIYTGKILPSKKIELILEAMKYLKDEKIKILIVGGGDKDYISYLKKIIKKLKIDNKILWHSPVMNKELVKYYSTSDVYILPHQASIGILEALSCGLPVIISRYTQLNNLLKYNNGFIFEEENPKDLARKMKKLLNSKLRKEMGRNSRRFVEKYFDWKIIAKQFLELTE